MSYPMNENMLKSMLCTHESMHEREKKYIDIIIDLRKQKEKWENRYNELEEKLVAKNHENLAQLYCGTIYKEHKKVWKKILTSMSDDEKKCFSEKKTQELLKRKHRNF